MKARDYGRMAEESAAALLAGLGYRLVVRNYRCRVGEIDLIAWDGGVLVFVEVKARRQGRQGEAVEAIDRRKLRRLRTVAGHYLSCHFRGPEPPCRFDAVIRGPGSAVAGGGSMVLLRGVG